MEKPKVIFFDAVGTLFGVKGSVGEVYKEIALEFGLALDAESLEQAFRSSFKHSSPPTFPGVREQDIPQQEFKWWKEVSKSTFARVDALNKFADFELFFARLYQHFAGIKPWYIYDDVIPTLQYWQRQKIPLGIISNFDTRLFQVLKLLELEHFFTSVTISSLSGSAKPDSQIFMTALAKHNCYPTEAWHIGDSKREDYQAARKIGINSWLLDRDLKSSIISKNQLPNLNSLR
ncbi:MAG: HAD-IA family hydrolase [Xenococcaceae cyanobacterium MO_188.B32]|nr:HAD-IA family hydrolase [Xenococcaceae cyanobacterium MO_188.B32]